MSPIRQSVALTIWGLRSLPSRPGAFLTSFVSIVLVAAVLTSLLSMGEGIHRFGTNHARADRAVIMSRGAPDPIESIIPPEALATIANDPQVRRAADGHPLASGTVTVGVDVMTREGTRGTVYLYGLTNPQVYPEIQLMQGRWPRPGVHELLASAAAQNLNVGLDISSRVPIRGADWTIVGTFRETGDLFDQALLADAATIMSAVGRVSFEQAVVILKAADELPRFTEVMAANPTLKVDVYGEAAIREERISGTRHFLDFVAYFIGAIMAGAATCAALSSAYSAVEARAQELATLRAIGFGSASIIASLITEALIIALIGAVAGGLAAWIGFSGRTMSTNALTFPVVVGPRELIISALWVLAIALLGSALPAVRTARTSVAAALAAA
ncbi:MAG TPA: ABC transporter permease [Steroidobacteraceae bacterium]|jgi:putative ABC transport system permease protein|nr:ABC transporter permease [Steroidobacteraceae bacterium]